MSTPSPSPSMASLVETAGNWVSTPVGSTVAGGLILAFVLWGLGLASKRHPFRAIGRGIRAAVVRVVKFARWVRRLKVVSARQWQARYDEGFYARSAEVAEERSWSPTPVFRLERERRGARFYWFWNYGANVSEIRLTSDPALFTFDEEPYFPGGIISGSGSQVHGGVTDRGAVEGVTFTATWRDARGDEQTGTFDLGPGEQVFRNHQDAYDRGRREERDEMEARIRVTSDPRWNIAATDDWDGTFVLSNLVDEAAARNVRVDPFGQGFRVLSAATWPVIEGAQEVTFQGEVIERRLSQVQLKVSWTRLNGSHAYEMVTPQGD